MNDSTTFSSQVEKEAYNRFRNPYVAFVTVAPLVMYTIIIANGMTRDLLGVQVSADFMAVFVYLTLAIQILSMREIIPFFYIVLFSKPDPEPEYVPFVYTPKPPKPRKRPKAPTPTEVVQSKLAQFKAGDFVAGYIYIIEDTELTHYYKIGKSRYPVQRITDFKVRLPVAIELIHIIQTDDCSALERLLHHRFASKRKHGEWFALDADDLAWIKVIDTANGHQERE